MLKGQNTLLEGHLPGWARVTISSVLAVLLVLVYLASVNAFAYHDACWSGPGGGYGGYSGGGGGYGGGYGGGHYGGGGYYGGGYGGYSGGGGYYGGGYGGSYYGGGGYYGGGYGGSYGGGYGWHWTGEGGSYYRGYYGGSYGKYRGDCVFPTAGFDVASGGPSYAGEPTKLQSTSTISQGTIVSIRWDFDRDGRFDDASGPVVDHVFAAGTNRVRLRVMDVEGEYDIAYRSFITVQRPAGQPPSVTQPPGNTQPPADTCAGKTGRKLAQCRTLERELKRCKKLKGKKRAACVKRAKALAKCELQTSGKRKKCIAKAKAIGQRRK